MVGGCVVFLQVARNYKLPHVTVSDCRHGDHGPPERVRDGLEKRLIGTRLGEVHGAREQHHSWKTTRSETNGRRPPPQFFILQHHKSKIIIIIIMIIKRKQKEIKKTPKP